MTRWALRPKDDGGVRRVRPERGFTLVEIMVVLVILGMAAVIAVPVFSRLRVQSKTNQALRGVQSIVDLARSEALKRHSPVALLYTAGTRTFTVFEDWDPDNADVATNGDGLLDGNEETIGEQPLDAELEWTGKPTGDGSSLATLPNPVIYAADGSLRSAGGVRWLVDTPTNTFRLRVNGTTGKGSIEMWLGGSSWTARREDWQWKY